MSEPFVNPLDDVNFIQGGGLWDGKTVTILSSKTDVDLLAYKDGSPVINTDTGEQSRRNVWKISGIAEDEDRERQETYSMGALVPTADGEGFVRADGSSGVLHKNSEAGRFSAALKAAGFDVGSLFDATTGKTVLSRLTGAQLTFKAEPKLDKNGEPKKNKKGYVENRFFPITFVGRKSGVGGNGVGTPTATDPGLHAFALETVTKVLDANGGSLSRANLLKEVGKVIAGDTRSPAVVSLLIRPEFFADTPITVDGATISI